MNHFNFVRSGRYFAADDPPSGTAVVDPPADPPTEPVEKQMTDADVEAFLQKSGKTAVPLQRAQELEWQHQQHEAQRQQEIQRQQAEKDAANRSRLAELNTLDPEAYQAEMEAQQRNIAREEAQRAADRVQSAPNLVNSIMLDVDTKVSGITKEVRDQVYAALTAPGTPIELLQQAKQGENLVVWAKAQMHDLMVQGKVPTSGKPNRALNESGPPPSSSAPSTPEKRARESQLQKMAEALGVSPSDIKASTYYKE